MKATVIKRLNKRNYPSAEGNTPLSNPLEPGDIIEVVEEVKGTFHGDPPNDKWFKTDQGYLVWSGGVTFEFDFQRLSSENRQIDTDVNFQNEVNLRIKNGNLNYLELTKIIESNSSGSGVAVAIFDTGINKSHVALADKFKGFETSSEITHPHGTLIAGLIGSSRKSNFTGVSPDSNLLDCGMFDKKGFKKEKFEDAVKKILELKKNSSLKGIVANFSFDMTSDSDIGFLTEHLESLSNEIIIVASAGEARSGINELAKERMLQFPSRLKNVISVGSIDSDFIKNENVIFNSQLKFIVPNFSYWSCTNKSNDDFGFVSKDSAATAVLTGLISNLISSGILGNYPRVDSVVEYLNRYSTKINSSSILSNFKLFQP